MDHIPSRSVLYFFIAAIIWPAIAFSAYGFSADILITPACLDTYFYSFSVSTNTAPCGIAFHVTMTGKRGDIETNDSSASLELITHTKSGEGLMVAPDALKAPVAVALRKEGRVWTADFVIPPEDMDNPDLFYCFGFLAHAMLHGKRIPMPSVDVYEIRLADFTGQISHELNGRWQADSGDTYEFTDDGTYEHWQRNPLAGGQYHGSGPVGRTGISSGTYSIERDSLILSTKGGNCSTNEFYVTKGDVDGQTGKITGTRYSFILISYRRASKTDSAVTFDKITKYDLLYR